METREEAAASVGTGIDEASEEMLEADLDPEMVSEEAFLAAKRMFMAGQLTSIEELRQEALRRTQEHDARDGIEETTPTKSPNSWRWDHPNPETF